MKTRGMKRDKAFLVMLPGLMQRWVREKKLEQMPRVFIDGLMKACYNNVMPMGAEMGLPNHLADPDTRFNVKRFNDALVGEVSSIDSDVMEQWVEDKARCIYAWWFTWPLGWFPKMRQGNRWVDAHGKIPFPAWWVWVLVYFFLKLWGCLPAMWDIASPWTGFGKVSFDHWSYQYHQTFEDYLTLGNKLLFLLTYFGAARRGFFRHSYLTGNYVKHGHWMCNGLINLFNPGNGRSR